FLIVQCPPVYGYMGGGGRVMGGGGEGGVGVGGGGGARGTGALGLVRGDLGRDGTAPVRAEVDDHPGLPRDHRRDDVAEDVGDPLDVHVDETVELLGG